MRPTPTSSTTSKATSTALRCIRSTKSRRFVKRYLDGAERDRLDPILDRCVAVYIRELDEDQQV